MDAIIGTILSSIIVGGLSLTGVIITNMMSNKKTEQDNAVNQAVLRTEINNLTEEVRKHNEFAQRIPVVEIRVKALEHRVGDLENKVEHKDN